MAAAEGNIANSFYMFALTVGMITVDELIVNNLTVLDTLEVDGDVYLPSLDANSVLTLNSSNNVSDITLTDGQTIIGSSIGAPLGATLTAGTGITITNGHNSISVAKSPNAANFSAFLNANQTVTAGASAIIIFNNTLFNVGSGYSTSNGLFNSPVAGLYYFTAQLEISTANLGDTVTIDQSGTAIYSTIVTSTTDTYIVSGLLTLAALNNISIVYNSTGGVNVTVIGSSGSPYPSYFGGYLVS